MTPDMTPADLIGSRVYDPTKGEWSTVRGPMILGNIIILDEINRGQPKTKSAALRPMQEHQAKIFDKVFRQEDGTFPKPYMVIATMNPIDSEGVSPLVEAEKDRFQRHKRVKYLTFEGEREVGRRKSSLYDPAIEVLLTPERILEMQQLVKQVYISPLLEDYVTMLVRATRPTSEDDGTDNRLLELGGVVKVGAGNRGTENTMLAAKARALRRGSWKVELPDILDVVHDVLRMRLIMDPTASARGLRPDKIVNEALASIDPADPTASLRAGVPSPGAEKAAAPAGAWGRLKALALRVWEWL
jgi:MoxR-like ATPase